MDAMLVEEAAHAGEGEIVAAQRRTFVSGDEGGGVETGAAVAAHLVHGQAHQRLYAREVDCAVFLLVFGNEVHLAVESATALYNAWQCMSGRVLAIHLPVHQTAANPRERGPIAIR